MSSRWILGSALLTCAMTTAVAAQSQQSPAAGRTAQDDERITVSGCLQALGAETAGTSGAVGSAPSPPSTPSTLSTTTGTAGDRSASTGSAGTGQRFMLINAFEGKTPGGGSGVTSPAPAGSGTTESAARAGATQPLPNGLDAPDANRTFLLRGNLPELGQHVGEQVEISGRRIASATPSAPANGAGSSPTGNDRVQPSRNDRPQFSNGASLQGAQEIEVTSLRMIASVCPSR